MISRIGNQQNSPGFKSLFKLTDARLGTKEAPLPLYQTFLEEVQAPIGFYMSRFDFFTCSNHDSEIMEILKKHKIQYQHSERDVSEFQGATIAEKAENAYKSFTSDTFTHNK